MARKKTPEDLEWEHIFSAIQFDSEPDAKYIKEAVIKTKTGKKFKLNGFEFTNVMEQERHMDPEDAIVESCKITLDFQKIKQDVTRFAINSLERAAKRYPKSTRQRSQTRTIRKQAANRH